jgi:hypothetical protein
MVDAACMSSPDPYAADPAVIGYLRTAHTELDGG